MIGIGLEHYAQAVLQVARPGFDNASQEERDVGLEGSVRGYVRLALLYWAPARVAALLRDIADSIDR